LSSATAGGAARERQPSHLWKPGSVVRLSIPIHGNKGLKTGLLRHLLKAAEIEESEL
jgi:predicted RNA binding protein YcfA (HicA-like mRNA interferase family)